jgi:hypothetical protein
VVDKETGHTGEFVRLDRNDLDQQFFVGKVSAGQLESLGEIGLIDVDDGPFRGDTGHPLPPTTMHPSSRPRQWTGSLTRLGIGLRTRFP